MVLWYYITVCILSFACCIIYYWKMRSSYSVHYTLVFILAFMSHFCYVWLALAQNIREAVIINKFLYVGGCYFGLVGLILIFSICKINLPKWVRFIMFLFSSFVYVSVLTSGYLPLFYKSVDLKFENGVAVLVKEYGPLHNVFLVQVALYLLATIFALVYGWFKRPDISRKNLLIGAFMQIFSIFAFFVGRAINNQIEWMALADLVDEIGFLIIMDRIVLYRVDDMVSSSILKEGKIGYVSLDSKRRFLSATDIAKRFLPDIAGSRADKEIENEELKKLLNSWIDDFTRERVSKTHIYRNGEYIFAVRVGNLYDGKRKRGYLLEISDDTAHQQHLEGIERINKNLNNELTAKTKLIQELRKNSEK